MLIVNASAGTGKTFTITRIINNILLSNNRDNLKKTDKNGHKLNVSDIDKLINWLKENIEDNFDLDQLAAITFTEKAATELINRIRKSLENSDSDKRNLLLAKLSKAKISTIHSFCLQILKQSLVSVNMEPWFIDPNIEILNGQLSDKIINKATIKVLDKNEEWIPKINEIIKKNNESNKGKDLIDFKSINGFVKTILKNYLYIIALPEEKIYYSSEKYPEFHKTIVDFSREIYEEIRKIYLRENKINFDAILYETYRYLLNSKTSLEEINKKIKLIIIDEFQDTDPLQWEILNLLSAKKILVGDIKQSIYRFRGAVPEILENLSKKFEPINLTTNFRSTYAINNFVKEICNKEFFETRKTEVLTAEKNKLENEKGVYFVDPFEINDYTYVVKLIKWVKNENLVDNYGKITVLSERKEELHKLEKELNKYDIKFAMIEEEDLFSKSEIIPIKAFLTFLSNPLRDDALLAYLTYLPFSINEFEIYSEATKEYKPLIERLKNCKNQKIVDALKIYEKYRNLKEFTDISRLLGKYMDETNYIPKISGLPNGEERYINVMRLMESIKDLEEKGYRFSEIIDELNRKESIKSKSLYENDPDSLKLMTIHKSKGLENEAIIYINPYREKTQRESILVENNGEKYRLIIKKLTEENQYPNDSSEEQRLFYVAITRAKKYLFLINEKYKIKNENPLLEGYVDFTNGNWKKDSKKLKSLGKFLDKSVIQNVPLKDIEINKKDFENFDIDLNYIDDYTKLSYKKFHSPTKLYKYEEIFRDTEEEANYLKDVIGFNKNDYEELFMDKYGYWREKDEGIAVHKLLEHIESGLNLKEVINRYFETEMKSIPEREKIREDLKKWIDSEIFYEISQSKESYNEFKIDKVFDVEGREIVLTGVVDKIYKNSKGKWVIVDYKYSNKREENLKKYKFQTEFYAFCLKDLLIIDKIKLIFLKEKPEDGIYTYNFKDIDFKKFTRRLSTHIKLEENK